jgi:LysM repeat protein/ABC-type branched-subunit amino acid transport system substrate-binding protein
MLMFLCLLAIPVNAQDGIKKSTKTETIDGKKFYLHTVEKGQTLYAIAKAYDLTVNDVLLENPDAMNGIKPGQVLRIPFQKPVQTPKPAVQDTGYFLHKVEAGETLYGIAKKYNISTDEIVKLNPEAKTGLRIGQMLKLPKSVSTQPVLVNNTANGGDTAFVTNKKPLYNIALMLPFQSWNAVNLDVDCILEKKCEFPAKSEAAVMFYQGALLAIDSMKRAGLKVKLHVYDVDDADSAKVKDILARSEFSGMDLIIGPLSPGPLYPVAQWGKEHNIPVCSPVSPVNKVLFKQPQVMKALPGISTQMEQLASFISGNHAKDNIILLNSGNIKDVNAGNTFRAAVNTALYPDGRDSIVYCKGVGSVQASLKKDRLNVIVVASNNQASVTDIIRLLYGYAEDYPIMLYGTSTWMTFDNMDFEYLEKLQFHFVAPYYVDYDSSMAVKRFIGRYEYYFHADPNSFCYAGYDVTMFMLSALNAYGTGFIAKCPELKYSGLQQEYSFYRSDAESGYENRGVRIVRVFNYRLERLK